MQAVAHVTGVMDNTTEKRYLVARKSQSAAQGFSCGVICFNNLGSEIEIVSINRRVIDSLHERGLIVKVGVGEGGSALYEPAEALFSNSQLLQDSKRSFGEKVTRRGLEVIAEKFYCRVEYQPAPKLFKVLRLDGRAFSNPYIDVSLGGIKVTQLTDLTNVQWHDEIAEVIKRSELL